MDFSGFVLDPAELDLSQEELADDLGVGRQVADEPLDAGKNTIPDDGGKINFY